MAEIKTALVTFCNSRSEIVATFANRITAELVPDGQTYPYAVFNEITAAPQYGHFGENGRTITIQFDIFGETQTQADAARDVLKSALSGYRGMVGNIYAGRVFVTEARGNWNQDVRNYRRILEVSIGTND